MAWDPKENIEASMATEITAITGTGWWLGHPSEK